MKSDTQIRDDVINELQWDPQISEPEAIGVAVVGGAVTLTGHVSTYAEKLAPGRRTRLRSQGRVAKVESHLVVSP